MAGIKIGLSGDWKRANRILTTANARIRVALDRAVMQEAQFFRTKVVEGFRTQAPGGKRFTPLADTTLAMRRFKNFGGSKALIVRGDLRNSITVTKRTTPLGVEAFVGVLRTARGKGGQSLFNIAQVHEFGSRPIVIRMTPAMRKFLAMVFKKELGSFGEGQGGTGVIVVKIPARPFMQPVIDKFFGPLRASIRFQSRVAILMNGTLGTMRSNVPGVTSRVGMFSTARQALRIAASGRVIDAVSGSLMTID